MAVPPEVRLATDCAAALDRGDKNAAQRLANEGLRLSAASGNANWQRRFEHLLQMATGASIKDPPRERPKTPAFGALSRMMSFAPSLAFGPRIRCSRATGTSSAKLA